MLVQLAEGVGVSSVIVFKAPFFFSTVVEYNSIHGGLSPKPDTYKSSLSARATCVPFPKVIVPSELLV